MVNKERHHTKDADLSHLEVQQMVRLHNNKKELYCTNEYFNWISHLCGAVLFIFALGALGAECGYYGCSAIQTVSCIVYAGCIIFMQTASALHHGVGLGGVTWKVYNTLRVIDYTSVYVAIWGSFLPFFTFVIPSNISTIGFVLTSLTAVLGIVLKCVFNERLPQVICVGLYVLMGWNGLAYAYYIVKYSRPAVMILLIVMGLLYSVGVIFFATERPILIRNVVQGHEIFHIFVLLGNIVHLINIAFFVVPTGHAFK